MRSRSPLDYDVSVSADKARRRRSRGMSGAVEGAERQCEHPGCEAAARYRAPRSPSDLSSYRWFCLDHVREYNARWNYFEEFGDEEIENYLSRSRLWDRPTWRFGEQPKDPMGAHPHAEGRAWERFGFRDPFEVLGERATRNPEPGAAAEAPRRRLPENLRRALEILGAEDGESREAIRGRYRALVKDLHPDMNAGDRRDEEALRRVLWAWDQVKDSPAFPA